MSTISINPDEFLNNWMNQNPLRHVNSQEKHCLNCEHKNECWGEDQRDGEVIVHGLTPEHFQLTESTGNRDWTEEEYAHHLQAIYAQQCNNFSSNDPRVREREAQRLLQTEHIQKVDEAKQKGWDW